METFWFGVIAVLWAGYFLLEGFDLGVGTLLPFVARNETERRIVHRSIGPVWDGNEVWLLVAGGATFAAFPGWYASMFSGFYLPFALLLVGLVVRGVGIEYRGKVVTGRGRRLCDAGFVVGSVLPALLLGVAFADLVRGVDLDAAGTMRDGLLDLVSPFGLLGGVVTLTLFVLHGAVFLGLRTEGPVRERARRVALWTLPVVAVAALTLFGVGAALRGGAVPTALAVLVTASVVAAAVAVRGRREGLAFVATGAASALVPLWVFTSLWPDALPSRTTGGTSLTVSAAASSPHTLAVMTGVALVMTPVVIAYQAWSYWVFRARVTGRDVAVPDAATVHRVVHRGDRSAIRP